MTAYDERFKFTSKERDAETGYDYFGARYYLPIISIFGSVDPLANKFIYNSPYVYCEGNPIKFVDPDGMEHIIHHSQEDATPAQNAPDDDRLWIFSHGYRNNRKTPPELGICKRDKNGRPYDIISTGNWLM